MFKDLLDNLHPVMKTVLDGLAVFTAALTFLNILLPAIASALSIIWLGVRLYDHFKYDRKHHLNKDN